MRAANGMALDSDRDVEAACIERGWIEEQLEDEEGCGS